MDAIGSGRESGQAVVIGGSMAGLLCARVLADHFSRVTVLERDPAPEGPQPRKGVPQARHIHALLAAGLLAMEDLFPGLTLELVAGGAHLGDMGRDTAWFHFGAWKPRFDSGIPIMLCTRPFLEWTVRQRVAALPSVTLQHGCSVQAPLTEATRSRVTGVQVKGPEGERSLPADLVVDASGRGTHTPHWLEALGYGRPPVEEIGIDLAYTSRFYAPPAQAQVDWKLLAQYPRSPGAWRAGFVSHVEGGRWVVSLNGYFGDHPPTDDEGFLDFARSLPTRDLYDTLQDARPLTPAVTHKVPSSRWLHYERLPRWPEGFVVLGDGVCAFNPIYGQGMTVACLGARLLGECLVREDTRRLAARFQRRLPAVVADAWRLSTLMDLSYPQASGRRWPGLGVLHRALGTFIDQTSLDVAACQRFYEVLHLRRGLGTLLRPDTLGPLLAYGVESLRVPLASRANVAAMPRAPGAPRPPADEQVRAAS